MTSGEPDDRTQKQVGTTTTVVPVAQIIPKIAGYEITREVAQGGMGIVYEGRHLDLNRPIALKMLPRTSTLDAAAAEKFLAEARVVAAIRHPNVVDVYDFGNVDQAPYLVMEYLAGGSLAERLKTGGPLPPTAAAELTLKIAEGVAAAHAQQVIHRDLKPANVLFTDTNEPKVVDFGLAKKVLADTTVTQAVQGTPQYMSPEQARGDGTRIDARTDVWALGVILYECLTGLRPFVAPDPYSMIRKIVEEPPTPPHDLLADRHIPRALETICLKCLEKNPADRYADANELAADVRRFLAGDPIVGRLSRPRRGLRWVWTALPVAALIGVGIAYLATPRPDAPVDPIRQAEVKRTIEALLRTPARPDSAPPHPVVTVENLDPPDLTAFQYVEDERIIDLRGWRPLPEELRASTDPAVGCSVTMRERLRMVKTAPAKYFTVESRTTGRQIVLRGLTPHPERAAIKKAEKPAFVGQQAMKVYQLALDVDDQPVDHEFELRTQFTFWSSLQKPEDQWFGAIGKEGTLKTTLILVFPDDRPYTTYRLRVAPTRQAEPEAYAGQRIVFEDPGKRWLYWEVPFPQTGRVYRIDWEW